MADLLRSAKSGSDWSKHELSAYNIKVVQQVHGEFFGGELPDVDHLDPLLLSGDIESEGIEEPIYTVLSYLDLASNANAGHESAVDDFAREILKIMEYQEPGTILRSRYPIPLAICGESRVAQTDVSLIQRNTTVLLVVQEDKTSISSHNPEPQVIAEAIAAFQYNNVTRSRLGMSELEKMTIPCITMIGTRPIFYKVPVTMQLSDAVNSGRYPEQTTIVHKCIVASQSRRLSEGMDAPVFRKLALQHYAAFRTLAKSHWSMYIV